MTGADTYNTDGSITATNQTITVNPGQEVAAGGQLTILGGLFVLKGDFDITLNTTASR